jgi:hypothetical protein
MALLARHPSSRWVPALPALAPGMQGMFALLGPYSENLV